MLTYSSHSIINFSFRIVSSTMETAKSLQCPICPERRGSKRALNRHISWHRRSQDSRAPEEPTDDERRVVLRDAQATTTVEPTICAEGRSASALRDPRVASSSSSPTSHLEKKQSRKRIDAAVLRLKERHRRDRTTLARPTEELAQWLVTTDGEVPWLTCVGIAVAAKHFAGTQSPRRKVTGPTAKRPAPPVPHELDAVRRPLFRDEPAESTSMGSAAIAPIDPPPSPSVRGRSRQSLDDEEWRIDIWRSYGSKEISPPSPIGCQLSPSWALGNSSPPSAERPLELWSPSSNDEPWGRTLRTRPWKTTPIRIPCRDGPSSWMRSGSPSLGTAANVERTCDNGARNAPRACREQPRSVGIISGLGVEAARGTLPSQLVRLQSSSCGRRTAVSTGNYPRLMCNFHRRRRTSRPLREPVD